MKGPNIANKILKNEIVVCPQSDTKAIGKIQEIHSLVLLQWQINRSVEQNKARNQPHILNLFKTKMTLQSSGGGGRMIF